MCVKNRPLFSFQIIKNQSVMQFITCYPEVITYIIFLFVILNAVYYLYLWYCHSNISCINITVIDCFFFFCEHAVSPTLSGNEVDWVNAVCLSWMYKVQQYELTGLNK